jgi:hypothetical protein
MQRSIGGVVVVLIAATGMAVLCAADGPRGHVSCTGPDGCPACRPDCKASWEDVKTQQSTYSLTYDYACTRAFDPWHAPNAECRCRPPCGNVIVKKRLYKAKGEETVERVPKYDVQMVPIEPCGCAACRRHDTADRWNPLHTLAWLLPW